MFLHDTALLASELQQYFINYHWHRGFAISHSEIMKYTSPVNLTQQGNIGRQKVLSCYLHNLAKQISAEDENFYWFLLSHEWRATVYEDSRRRIIHTCTYIIQDHKSFTDCRVMEQIRACKLSIFADDSIIEITKTPLSKSSALVRLLIREATRWHQTVSCESK